MSEYHGYREFEAKDLKADDFLYLAECNEARSDQDRIRGDDRMVRHHEARASTNRAKAKACRYFEQNRPSRK